jgi:hypothetical protein
MASLAAWRVFVQARGEAPVAAYQWDIEPVNVPSRPDSLWD